MHLTNQPTHHQEHQPELAGEHGCYLDEDGKVDRIKIVCCDTAKAQVTTARYQVATRTIGGHCGDHTCMSSCPPHSFMCAMPSSTKHSQTTCHYSHLQSAPMLCGKPAEPVQRRQSQTASTLSRMPGRAAAEVQCEMPAQEQSQ